MTGLVIYMIFISRKNPGQGLIDMLMFMSFPIFQD